MTERDPDGILEECRREIKELRRDLYGNPDLRQKGVYERLDILEKNVADLERAKVEAGYFERIEADIASLRMDYRITNVYLKAIVWGGGAVAVSLIGAGLLGAFRALGGF